jgi:hypothetical protein
VAGGSNAGRGSTSAPIKDAPCRPGIDGNTGVRDTGYTCAGYQILFVGGQGVLQIRTVVNNAGVNGDDTPTSTDGGDVGTGNGFVEITPTTAGACDTLLCGGGIPGVPGVTAKVAQFTVAGAFAADLYDDNDLSSTTP